MKKPHFEFDPTLHRYTLDGYTVPGVTQTLKLAGLAVDYDACRPDQMELARQRGNAVHAATALDDAGELDDTTLDPRLTGYLEAWRKFKAEVRPKFSLIEARAYSTRYRFAGTIDRVCEVRGRLTILDLKTTASVSAFVALQLAGYELLHRETCGRPIRRPIIRGAVQLDPAGTYKLAFFHNPTDGRVFLAAAEIANWRFATGV